jgi:hypothetical protein
MSRLFSKRHTPPPEQYRYDLPEDIRWRIVHSIEQLNEDFGGRFDIDRMLQEVGERILREYGGLLRPSYDAARVSDHAVVQHFFSCDERMALDFIEMCFQVWGNCGRQKGVDAINEVFRDAAIGYELTPFVEIQTNKPGKLYGRLCGTIVEYQYPKIVMKNEQLSHEATVRPCLELLADPRFRTANTEMLKAHDDYRKGEYADAITSCGSAFESVLKTICDHHGWTYDPDKDTCSKLVGICRDNGLFPPFYAPIFEATGTIRNKLGDAHGRGPTPVYVVGKEHVDHMIQMTSAHIILLVGLAKF